MRAAALFAALLVPAVANAEPKPGVVWKNRVIDDGVAAPLTSVSHKLYLNNCMPNGCTVSPGLDNSLTNRSSIPNSQVTLDPYSHGDQHWELLVQCVRDTFKPFDIEIVTEDPGNVSHFEVMIGGTSRQLDPDLEAGGVAPFISCGATRNNTISFVFAGTSGSINFLCGAVAQEACHVWGLDHELNADDPMTYLELGSSKRFQNDDADCGEDNPRRCRCGGNTQNSYRYMTDTFGLNPTLLAPTLQIATPSEGAWVKPRFPVSANFSSELTTIGGQLSIDGNQVQMVDGSILAFNAPDLPGGPHAIEVEATDAGDRTVVATVNVNVMAACSAAGCPANFHCVAGACMPGANEQGGFGASCGGNAECISQQCATDGTDSYCTTTCEAGACPGGFECITESNVCWPTTGGGGCSSGGGGSSLAFAGIGALALAFRRRQRSGGSPDRRG